MTTPTEVLEAGAVDYIRRKLDTTFDDAAGRKPAPMKIVRREELAILLAMAERQASRRGGEA